VAEVFAAELAALPPDEADDLLAALDLSLSWPAWEALRTRGCPVDQTTRVVDRTVRALLSP
jgi:hypothetical protein